MNAEEARNETTKKQMEVITGLIKTATSEGKTSIPIIKEMVSKDLFKILESQGYVIKQGPAGTYNISWD